MVESRRRCIAPGSASAVELMAWARGDAATDVRAHVRRCAHCQAEASAYARADDALRKAFFRRSCPPSLTLGEYALGMLGPRGGGRRRRALNRVPALRGGAATLCRLPGRAGRAASAGGRATAAPVVRPAGEQPLAGDGVARWRGRRYKSVLRGRLCIDVERPTGSRPR